MEQIDPLQRGIGQPRQHIERIAHMKADIVQPLGLHMLERADHAVDEGLAANQAVVGMQFRLSRQMLSGAETDLELQRTTIAKQCAGIERTIRNTDPRQQVLDKPSLPDP